MEGGHRPDGKDAEEVGRGCHAQEGRGKSALGCQGTRGPDLGGGWGWAQASWAADGSSTPKPEQEGQEQTLASRLTCGDRAQMRIHSGK